MLRFTKETDLERVQRLRRNILEGYIESESSTELLVSVADLRFLLIKAEEQVGFEVESSNPNDVEISPITTEFNSSDPMMNNDSNNDPF